MSIKEKCDHYLDTRVYNFVKAKKRKKAILRDRQKFQKFKFYINIIDGLKSTYYSNIFLGYDVKNSFIKLHFIKMLKHYTFIKFYHENIKKINHNTRLLSYFESNLGNLVLKINDLKINFL